MLQNIVGKTDKSKKIEIDNIEKETKIINFAKDNETMCRKVGDCLRDLAETEFLFLRCESFLLHISI